MFVKLLLKSIVCLWFLAIWKPLGAMTYVLPEKGHLIGELQMAEADFGETLLDVGLRYDIGIQEIQRANPQLNPNQVLPAKTSVLIPSKFIIPDVDHRGIVINLAEFRMYFFLDEENLVMTYPVSIGREGWKTPLGRGTVGAKKYKPSWKPTQNIKKNANQHGFFLPDEIPPNANNPLGKYVIQLSWPTYLIHGSNHSSGIGTRVSAGCIRMINSDIEELYELIKIGTQVTIINQPIKTAHEDGHIFLEVHPALTDFNSKPIKIPPMALAQRALKEKTGIPIQIQ